MKCFTYLALVVMALSLPTLARAEATSVAVSAAASPNPTADKSQAKAAEGSPEAALETELKKLKLDAELAKARHEATLAESKREQERLETEAALSAARRKRATESSKLMEEVLAAENALLKQKLQKLKSQNQIAQTEHETLLATHSHRLAAADTRDRAKSRVVGVMEYATEPFRNGELTITDRRISLNGVITPDTATYVTERLHFFNNQSSDPIFIVIDASPGGAVAAGYRILKAMEASEAPVHVVVKSFAASMAAIITTLAEHSYAYPNAVLLHHQMSYQGAGNMTRHEEKLRRAREWEQRIMDPLAAKLGTTPEAFVKSMYENESTGDWAEFADVAQGLKWVNQIVDRLREVGVTKQPGVAQGENGNREKSSLAPIRFDGEEQIDGEGRRFKRLPRLHPFDYYFVFDPDGYYRK